MKSNSDSVYKKYYIADTGTTYEGDKSYRIIGTEDQTVIIDSVSDREINDSIAYVNRMEKTSEGITIPLYHFRPMPIITYSREYGKLLYKIFGIKLDPKAIPCIMNFLRENNLSDNSFNNIRLHITQKNEIFKISLL